MPTGIDWMKWRFWGFGFGQAKAGNRACSPGNPLCSHPKGAGPLLVPQLLAGWWQKPELRVSVIPHAGQELQLPGFALSWDKQTHVNQTRPVAPAGARPGNCPATGTDAVFLCWFGASGEGWGQQRGSGGAAHGNLGRISALPVSPGQILSFGKALRDLQLPRCSPSIQDIVSTSSQLHRNKILI